MSTKFELPFDTCFACFQKNDDNCSCKSRKMYEQGKTDGAKEFAEWLATKRGFSKEWVEWHIDHWQKGAE